MGPAHIHIHTHTYIQVHRANQSVERGEGGEREREIVGGIGRVQDKGRGGFGWAEGQRRRGEWVEDASLHKFRKYRVENRYPHRDYRWWLVGAA